MIKKIWNICVSDFYKIELIRTFIVLLRFIYFYHIRKNIKYNIDPNKKIDEHINVKKKGNKLVTVIGHNMHFVTDLLNLNKTYLKFNGSRATPLYYPLKSIDFVDYGKSKVLSVGPRNEAELFVIRSLGFAWKNISAIDLISYSKLIELGDIHKTTYEDSFFDIIGCGWVLPYSNNYEKIIEELIRITKNGGLIHIGWSYDPNEEDISIHDDKRIILNSTKQIIDKFKDNIMNVILNIDARSLDAQIKRHSILIIRIKK